MWVFLVFSLLLISSICQWWSHRMHWTVSINLYCLRLVLWPIIWSIFKQKPWPDKREIFLLVLGWSVYLLNLLGSWPLLVSWYLCLISVSKSWTLMRVRYLSLPVLLCEIQCVFWPSVKFLLWVWNTLFWGINVQGVFFSFFFSLFLLMSLSSLPC